MRASRLPAAVADHLLTPLPVAAPARHVTPRGDELMTWQRVERVTTVLTDHAPPLSLLASVRGGGWRPEAQGQGSEVRLEAQEHAVLLTKSACVD